MEPLYQVWELCKCGDEGNERFVERGAPVSMLTAESEVFYLMMAGVTASMTPAPTED